MPLRQDRPSRSTGPDLVVYLSVPPHASSDPAAVDLIDAEELACDREAGTVGPYSVHCARVQAGELSDNARAVIQDASAVAYIGEIAPGSSAQTVGITNALQILQVSPTDGALELTRPTPADPGAPSMYYEQWSAYGRTFAHIAPSTEQEAAVLVAVVRADSARAPGALFVGDDGSSYGRALAHAVTVDAAPGVPVSTNRSGARAVYYASDEPTDAAKWFDDVATVNPTARLYGPAALDTPAFVQALSTAAAKALTLVVPGVLTKDLTATARQSYLVPFTTKFGHAPAPSAIFGYAAVDAVFHVLRTAGSTRTTERRSSATSSN